MERTKEDIKKLSILEVANSLGMELRKSGRKEYYWTVHDSLKINPEKNFYNWYSKGIYGDVISLVQEIKKVSYKEAYQYLKYLNVKEIDIEKIKKQKEQEQEKKFYYALGKYKTEFTEARKYLKEHRSLSDETIDFFLSKNLLDQVTRTIDNYSEPVIVFKYLNEKKEIVGGSLQGIKENKEKYHKKGYLKQIMYGSKTTEGFNIEIGKANKIIIFEAPIDLMSYYELKKDWLKDVKLIAMDGLKEGVIDRHYAQVVLPKLKEFTKETTKGVLKILANETKFFQEKENVENLLKVAVDNDEAGRKFIERLKEEKIKFKTDLPPLGKAEKTDWNDILKIKKIKEKGEKQMTEEIKQQEFQNMLLDKFKMLEEKITDLEKENKELKKEVINLKTKAIPKKEVKEEVEEEKTTLENTQKELEKTNLTEKEKPLNSKDYWTVEFNETSKSVPSYVGKIVNKELIDEIKELDEQIHLHNETVGKDEYGKITDEYEGYSKFYFDHVENGKVTEHLRIDIGDGEKENEKVFQYLYEQVEKVKEKQNQGQEIKEEKRTWKNRQDYIKEQKEKGTWKNRQEYIKEQKEKFIKEYEEGLKMINSPENLKKMLDMKNHLNSFATGEGKKRKYSTNNILSLLGQAKERGIEIEGILTIKDWNKLGRMVKTGEKAFYISQPITEKKLDEQGNIIKNEKGKIEYEIKGFKRCKVFTLSQTTGEQIIHKVKEVKPGKLDYINIFSAVKEIVKEKGIGITFSSNLNLLLGKQKEAGSIEGVFLPERNLIVIQKGLTLTKTIKTLFHETVHALNHAENKCKFGDEIYKKQELEAESIAYLLSKHYGIDSQEYSFNYIKGYLQDKENLLELKEVLDNIIKISDKLQNKIDSTLEKIKIKEKNKNSLEQRIEKYQKQEIMGKQKTQQKEITMNM